MVHSNFCPINFRWYGLALPWFQRVRGKYGCILERRPDKRLPHPRKAAGAQISQSRHGEVVTINTDAGPFGSCNWNEYNLNPLTRNNWRASLVPAAAVIPAPIAYIKVVAVKKLVVEPWAWLAGPPHRVYWSGRAFPSGEPHALHWACWGTRTFTLKKLECSKQAFARIH